MKTYALHHYNLPKYGTIKKGCKKFNLKVVTFVLILTKHS